MEGKDGDWELHVLYLAQFTSRIPNFLEDGHVNPARGLSSALSSPRGLFTSKKIAANPRE